MFRTYIFILIALLSPVLAGCTTFYSDNAPCVTQTPEIGKSVSQASASDSVVPDLPRLEPIQLAKDAQDEKNTVNSASVSPIQPPELPADAVASDSYLPNPFANGGKIVSTQETTPVDKPEEIQVVRLPQTEPAAIRKISGGGGSSVILPTSFESPSSPTPEAIVQAESAPTQPAQTKPSTQWRRASGEEQVEPAGLLSMTPGVLDIDKQASDLQEKTEKSPEAKVALLPTLPEEESHEVDILLGEAQSNLSKTESTPQLAESMPQNKTDSLAVELQPIPSENSKSAKKSDEILQCSAAAPLDAFEVHSLTFVTAIRKKGDFSAVNKPYSFASGQTLLAYMEIENPQKAEKLKTGFEITDSNGKKVISQDNASDAPAGEASFFQYVKFALPEKISAGQYTLRVWGKPSNVDTVSSSSVSFKVE